MKSEVDTLPREPSESDAAEPQPLSGEAALAEHDEFEEEEQRFFSEPPAAYEEASEPGCEQPIASAERATPSVPALSRAAAEKQFDPGLAEQLELPPLSARQRLLRRRVAGSMGALLAFLLLGFVVRKRIEAADQARDTVRPVALAIPKTAIAPGPTPAVVAAPILVAAPPPPPPTASTGDSAPAVAVEDTAALLRSARSLLGAGRAREGVAAAREAVQKNPLDAESYILLAAGLQDLGAWTEARAVFTDCLRKAQRGTSSACQYFAHR
jgi:hypothetical protein